MTTPTGRAIGILLAASCSPSPSWYPGMRRRFADALAAKVERVRALHFGEYVEDEDRNRCFECGDDWPCPTVRAMDEGVGVVSWPDSGHASPCTAVRAVT